MFFFSSRRRHTRFDCDWSSDVCSSDLISPGRNIQAIPYGAFTGARFLDTEVPAFRHASDRRLGLDLKTVVRDAVTLDGTVNPDFSQVESDEPQVTINERFEVFFPEKRPFFIENAGYLQTPEIGRAHV